MTNLDPHPDEQVCVAGPAADVELVEPRDVPLGGPRAMTVRRTLPSRARSLVGPFCFADHYGPDDVAATGGMDVPPHPHTGLQTVTWLFEGSVLHRDALGSEQVVVPGQLNLMTAGRGICHSEEATPALFPEHRVLHGVQLWTVLPESARHGERAFDHVADVPTFTVDGALVRVFMGALGPVASPARAYSPLVAAQVDVPAGARVVLPVDPTFEHGVLVDTGVLRFEGHDVARSWLAYAPPGRDVLVLEAGDAPVRAVLMGGAPFDEPVLMWWNFVGRTHDEVVEARAQWQAAIAGDTTGLGRFGEVHGYAGPPLPAPELPHVRLRPRER
ncbi:pirin family protein [Cellulomonas dongxiuzhuiae]|uniref:pirin family protein n=1 Tax=Cellulomonas dongxiuzhuiae TaxID=2819979 RepID=UPI001AAF06C0|nr:pirin family protein [Cellulomonas dongxiuzhuiae]MBO3089821.1 pirin family protein [Cellulomonas dongxiuzhuiae]